MTKTTPETCDIWDTDYNSDSWEPEFMTFFVSWQLRATLDSIRNSCDVWMFKLVFSHRLPFHSLDVAVFEGSRDPPAQPGWLFIPFITSIHQVILVLLMFNWFMGPKKSFSGSYLMLTLQNISESIWDGPYLVKRLVANNFKRTPNRLTWPKLLQMSQNFTEWFVLVF